MNLLILSDQPYTNSGMFFEIQKLDSFTGHKDAVYNIVAGADENHFISAAGDGLIVNWNTSAPDLGRPLAKVASSVYALLNDPIENELWIGQNFEGLQVIDLISKKVSGSIKLNSSAIFDLKLWNGSIYVASGDGTISVIDQKEHAFKKHIKSSDKSVRCLAINPVERELAAGYSDHSIRIFDLQTFELKRQLFSHKNSVFCLSYSPDFTKLISGSRDARMLEWDVENEYKLNKDLIAHMYTINHLDFSPDGEFMASCSMDKSIKLWRTADLKLLKVIDKGRHAGHGTSINRVMWLNNKTLISCSDDRSIAMWEIKRI